MYRARLGKKLPFLLIGGYAVLVHGFVRTTGDVDFLIRKSEAKQIETDGATTHRFIATSFSR